jgi:UDP:flavonoid glycosyltransferase YjiC (YdhE family)
LRAGLPQVIIPFGWDQTFWAHRIAKLGIGAKPLTAPSITAEQLAEAINEVTTNENIRSTARHFGELIRNERGVERAIKAIERFARGPTGVTSF